MSIEKPLLELKSSSNPKELGLYSEYLAAQFYLRSSFQLYFHSFKTPFAEIDLIVGRPGELRLVEVKRIMSPVYAATRITRKQVQRLQRAYVWASTSNGSNLLQLRGNKSVHMDLVYVYSEQRILCHRDFLSSLP